MSRELWKAGVKWTEKRPDGNLRHSQLITGYGPGALVDFVDEAAIMAGLSWWAKGPKICEDRLLSMLAHQKGYEGIELYAPPQGNALELDDKNRKWIKAFQFPEWFVCQNERCWEDSGGSSLRDGARPRRLLHINQLDGKGHKCKEGKGTAHRVQPVRFTRACRKGHVDDIEWFSFVHLNKPACLRPVLWVDEAGANGDLQDVRVSCSGCKKASQRMSVAAQKFSEGALTLGKCEGKRPWLGGEKPEGCDEPMRFLLRSASHAYFSVTASVIHVPDRAAEVRERVAGVYEHLSGADDMNDVAFFRKKQKPIAMALEGLSDEAVWAEVERRKEGRPVMHKKIKEAEIELLQSLPMVSGSDRPEGRFYGRAMALPKQRSKVMERVERVVLIHRLSEVRALLGFTRFEAMSADVDGELDIGAEVARLDEPLTWLPAVENFGEGFFFSLNSDALSEWEKRPLVQARAELFRKGFKLWQQQREDRKAAKADFVQPRFVLLHSLAHLLITAVSLDCGYAASAVRERIYCGTGGHGIMLYTASSGAEGSLGGLVEVGRHLSRYLENALDLGRLCSNDPVCSAHDPAHELGVSDRYLEGASCHGCLLISEPSCERMNQYLDRTLVVPTVESAGAAFFR